MLLGVNCIVGLVDFDGTLRCELVVSLLVLAAKLMDFVAFDKLG